VTLQSWRHVVHVWHMFDEQLAEAGQAFAEIGRFLEAKLPPVARRREDLV
jgi:hypothetical protein